MLFIFILFFYVVKEWLLVNIYREIMLEMDCCTCFSLGFISDCDNANVTCIAPLYSLSNYYVILITIYESSVRS